MRGPESSDPPSRVSPEIYPHLDDIVCPFLFSPLFSHPVTRIKDLRAVNEMTQHHQDPAVARSPVLGKHRLTKDAPSLPDELTLLWRLLHHWQKRVMCMSDRFLRTCCCHHDASCCAQSRHEALEPLFGREVTIADGIVKVP